MTKHPESMKIRQDRFLEFIETGHTITSACEELGITRTAYYLWRHRNEEFRRDADLALISQISVVEDALFKKALGGNVTAQIFYLINRGGGKWQHCSRVYHSASQELQVLLSTDRPKIIDSVAHRDNGENGSNGKELTNVNPED